MSELPHPWSAYQRLQDTLARRRRVDDYTWGLEAGLNRPLQELPAPTEQIDRAVRSASRKERHRTQLRRAHLGAEDLLHDPHDGLHARQRLRFVRANVTADDWTLLRAVGEGHEYKEIAVMTKVAAGTLRARVLRLRRALALAS